MKKITLFGGFHNSNEISINVTDSQYEDIKSNTEPLSDILSDYQIRRLNRHFCGVSDCKCGGVARASISL